jgi:hypothetical protein
LLFNKLPDEIFKPLAGPNRYLYEEILLFLFRYFSDEDLTNEAIFPRRSHVKREIEELLARKGRLLSIINEEESGDDVLNIPERAADYIYKRLVQTGWLEEEMDGYHVNVLMPPHASLLLEALEGVANSEKKNYGSTIASIYLQLDAIVNRPTENARAFVEVVRSARDFTRHLQNIFSGLRGFQDLITRQRDPKLALSTFFDDFIENLLISDYKSLQAENNPFRHRTRVLDLLFQIEHLESPMEALTEVYREDRRLSQEQAREKVLQDLRFIARVFLSVDRRLDAIDLYRMRLESRVAELVRHMDRNVPDMTNRGIKLLEKLSKKMGNEADGNVADLPQPSRWFTLSLVSPRSARKPHKRRQPQYIELPKEKELDPEIKGQKRLIKEYLQRRVMSPAKIEEYLDRQMMEKTSLTAEDFEIETVEDLLAFAFVPFLGHMRGSSESTFSIRRTGKRIETPWMECSDFVVERKR